MVCMSMCTDVPLKVVGSSHRWSENTCGTFVFVILKRKSTVATSDNQTDINIKKKSVVKCSGTCVWVVGISNVSDDTFEDQSSECRKGSKS